MKIIDTYPEILSLLDRLNGEFDMSLWENYITDISEELCDKLKEDSAIYDFHRDIRPVLLHAMRNRKKLETAHDSFLSAVYDLDGKVKKLTGTELQADIIFYLGLCNGAGWAMELTGKPTVLLGVEKIIELDWCGAETMASLIYHELGHIWHDVTGGARWEANTMRGKYILQLYREGIAMYFEQFLTGGSANYHQDQDGWLHWCRENRQALNAEYLRRLRANESAETFFGDWQAYRGHSDIGYFIGCEFIRHLAAKRPIDELARLDLATVYAEFEAYATQN
ncbi:MAG: hypothetical protein FWF10_08160 [Clostridiales bacterium]|nr:hypothetical protein [Clostridiales bacterium]